MYLARVQTLGFYTAKKNLQKKTQLVAIGGNVST